MVSQEQTCYDSKEFFIYMPRDRESGLGASSEGVKDLLKRINNEDSPVLLTKRKPSTRAVEDLPEIDFPEEVGDEEIIDLPDDHPVPPAREKTPAQPPAVPKTPRRLPDPPRELDPQPIAPGETFDELLGTLTPEVIQQSVPEYDGDAGDIEEASPPENPKNRSTAEVRQKRSQEAHALAQDFPGLILDSRERQARSTELAAHIDDLDDSLNKLREERNQYLLLRQKMKKEGATIGPDGGSGLELDQRIRLQEAESASMSKEFLRLHAYATAEEDISDRLDTLTQKREQARNNPLTLKGLDTKIQKLESLQRLWQSAQTYESKEDIAKRETEKADRLAYEKGLTRHRRHEMVKNLRAKPKPKAEAPKIDLEALAERGMDYVQAEYKRNADKVSKEAREKELAGQAAEVEAKKQAKIDLYQGRVDAKLEELRKLAEKLTTFGRKVELPNVVKRDLIKEPKSLLKSLENPSAFARFRGWITKQFQDPEETRSVEQFERGTEEYHSLQEALADVKAGRTGRRPSALRGAR